MPLLKRTAFTPQQLLPDDLRMDEELFVIRITGEAVRDYDDYLARLKTYRWVRGTMEGWKAGGEACLPACLGWSSWPAGCCVSFVGGRWLTPTPAHPLFRSRSWTCQYTGKTCLTYEEALREEDRSHSLLSKFPPDLEEACAILVHHSTMRLEDLINHVWESQKPGGKTTGKENEPDARGGKHPLSKPVIRRWILEVRLCPPCGPQGAKHARLHVFAPACPSVVP